MKKVKEFFYKKEYKNAIVEIKKALQDDSENSELWYHLFLAENGDYFTTDFDSGYTNELSFNKALEIASRRKRAGYLSEYNFYKTISKCNGLNILFRYAQYGNILEFGKSFRALAHTIKINIPKEELYTFYDNLDYIVNTAPDSLQIDLYRLLVNYLYIDMQNKDILEILTDLTENSKKSNSPLANIYSDITESKNDINYFLNVLFEAYNNKKTQVNQTETVDNSIPYKYKDKVHYIGDFEISKEFLKLYNGHEDVIVVPTYIKKISVAAFSRSHYHASIREVVIPDSVTYLGDSMFKNCSSLRYVRLSDNIKSILAYTFENCQSLWNIVIPRNVASICDYVFYNCTNLKKIDFLGMVKTFGSSSFEGCTSLKEVVLPNSLIGISDCAYKNCTKLETIVIQPYLEYFGNNVFEGCTNLKNVYFNGNIAQWCTINFGENSNPAAITQNLYILDNFGNVEYNGRRYRRFETLNENDTIHKLSNGTFRGLNMLEDISLSNSIQFIGSSSFADCQNLKTVKLPDNCANINDLAFSNCTSLKEIYLGKELKYIGRRAFENCISLDNIKIPETFVTVYNYAFMNCKSLKNIDLLDNCASIEEHAFDGCESLKSFKAGTKFRDICQYSFSDCVSLEEVKLGGIEKVYQYAFKHCNSLKEIYFPDGLRCLYDHAFDNCESLEVISLPSTVSNISPTAIFNCMKLKKIIFRGKKSQWNKVYFSDKNLFGSKTKKMLKKYLVFES